MHKVSRKISLEPFKSRVPSTLDSYNSNPTMIEISSTASGDVGENADAILLQIELSDLTNNSIVSQGNYGKIPRNVVGDDGKVYSWATISQRHKFYKDYYNLLQLKGECGNKPYGSAIEYYEKNILPNDINENLKSTYEELDKTFERYSGETSVKFIFEDCYNEVMVPWGKEFEYETEEFKLSYELYFEWNCITMYYTTIVKWLAWFEERYYKYNYDITSKEEVEEVNCSASNDCCDCTEYLRLGGKIMYKWLSSIKLPSKVEYRDASLTIPIFIGNTIDDLGEMSNMAEEWEPGIDYSSTSNNIGTVVSYLDNDWVILGSGCTGTKYNDAYKEMYFGNLYWTSGSCLDGEYKWNNESGENHWTRRIDEYYKNNAEFILSGETSGSTYAYKDGKYVNSPSESIMSDTYIVNSNDGNGYCLINDILYPIEYINYVKFVSYDKFLRRNNGRIYEVYKHGDAYYTIIDGVTYYGESTKNTSGNTDVKFTFGRYVSGNVSSMQNGKFIRYKGELYQVNGENEPYVQVNTNKKYKVIYGYFITKNEKRYYVKKDENEEYKIVKPIIREEVDQKKDKYYQVYDWEDWRNNPLGVVSDSEIKKGTYILTNDKAIVCPYYEEYKKEYISGKTESKLSSLRTYSIAKDDLGNQLPGMFQKEMPTSISGDTFLYNTDMVQFGKYPLKKPKQDGDWLDCYYQVGNVSDVEKIVENDEGVFYWGNLLHSMEFYYEDASGVKLQETSVSITTDSKPEYNISGITNANIASGLTYHHMYTGNINYNFSFTTEIDEILRHLPTTYDVANLLPFATNVTSGGTFNVIGKSGMLGTVTKTITDGEGVITEIESSISEELKKNGVVISLLDAIKLCDILRDVYVVQNGETANISDTMKCKINYNIGAILNKPSQYCLSSEKHKGVEYTETLDVIPNSCVYYINETTQLELNYYDLKPQIEQTIMNDYGNAQVSTRMADFKVQISYWNSNSETSNNDIFKTTDEPTNFDPMNDTTAFPMFRRECCLGFSSIENIKGDIYIDRGVARAFDSHLKMGEIKTFEALENYGNGAFRIEIS